MIFGKDYGYNVKDTITALKDNTLLIVTVEVWAPEIRYTTALSVPLVHRDETGAIKYNRDALPQALSDEIQGALSKSNQPDKPGDDEKRDDQPAAEESAGDGDTKVYLLRQSMVKRFGDNAEAGRDFIKKATTFGKFQGKSGIDQLKPAEVRKVLKKLEVDPV